MRPVHPVSVLTQDIGYSSTHALALLPETERRLGAALRADRRVRVDRRERWGSDADAWIDAEDCHTPTCERAGVLSPVREGLGNQVKPEACRTEE